MILIIGHDASLTGAPKFLLNFSLWLKTEKKEELFIILRNGGPLLVEYKNAGNVFLWNTPYIEKPFYRRLINKITGFYKKRKENLLSRLAKSKIDLIFCNTVTNGEILKALAFLKVPIIMRVPELETVFRLYDKNAEASESLKIADHIIAVSNAVKENLVARHNVSTEKMSVIHGFIPQMKVEDYKAAKDKFIVGGCGTLISRKGFDLFLQTANIIVNSKGLKDIHFLWIGGDKDSFAFTEFNREIEILNLQQHITITGETTEPGKYYSQMSVFLMTSREDPFPLVNLEAAQFGLPIICFDKSGGSPEFVTENVGFAVPYLDVSVMADKIEILKNDMNMATQLSSNIREKSQLYNVEIMAEILFALIEQFKVKKQ
jgi:glycosyltransferase involved in cell wall biosynthesis